MKKNFRKFKTCAGCGGKNLKAETSGPTNKDPIWIQCMKCSFAGPPRLTVDEAIKAWNKRALIVSTFEMKKPTPIW